ncbi:hypothetical protein KUCAC02_033210, partial [Chaenocephalus aceratus]
LEKKAQNGKHCERQTKEKTERRKGNEEGQKELKCHREICKSRGVKTRPEGLMSADYEPPSEQDMECVLTAGSPGDGRSDGRERPQAAGASSGGSVLRRQGASSGGRERPQAAGSVLRRQGASSGGRERPQAAGSVLRRQGASSGGREHPQTRSEGFTAHLEVGSEGRRVVGLQFPQTLNESPAAITTPLKTRPPPEPGPAGPR